MKSNQKTGDGRSCRELLPKVTGRQEAISVMKGMTRMDRKGIPQRRELIVSSLL